MVVQTRVIAPFTTAPAAISPQTINTTAIDLSLSSPALPKAKLLGRAAFVIPSVLRKAASPGGASSGEGERSITIRQLIHADFSKLHECWHSAFSDYPVPPPNSEEELRIRLRQNSYDPSLSLGAFIREGMIGFWLSGMRLIGGVRTAYDSGTALIKEWRGKGISQAMALAVEGLMRQSGIARYALEVIADNEPAISVYAKNGFNVNRILLAFEGNEFRTFAQSKRPSRIEAIGSDEALEHLDGLMEYEPSWQNSRAALENVRESTVSAAIIKRGEIVAAGIFQPFNRRIAQIGIRPGDRAEEIHRLGSLVRYFHGMVGGPGNLEIINIPPDAERMIGMLRDVGFSDMEPPQYEMIKEFK